MRGAALLALLTLFPLAPAHGAGRRIAADRLYRLPMGSEGACAVWIVDGGAVRREVDGEFLYGGNGERYRYIPAHELWIDAAISVEEYAYTVAHEASERALMARRGMSYDDAHDSALAVERAMRLDDEANAHRHERSLARVSPTDCDDLKEISFLPDSIALRDVYRVPLRDTTDTLRVWIVDGAVVRRDIFPDFGFSGNDLAYHFIPRGEIWLDNAMTCDELPYAIAAERVERADMAARIDYDPAYEHSLRVLTAMRREAARAVHMHAPVRVTTPLTREVGTGSEPTPSAR